MGWGRVRGDPRLSEPEHLGQNGISVGDAQPGRSQGARGEGENHGKCEHSRPLVEVCVGSARLRAEFRALIPIWEWPVFTQHFETRD